MNPRKKWNGRLLTLSLLTAILAIALFWWIQQSASLAGRSTGSDSESGNASITTVQEQAGILAIVGTDGASLYDAPGGFEIANFGPGEELTAVGRTEDKNWVSVEAKNGQVGWTPEESVVLVGLDRLPVTGENAPATDNGAADDGDDSTAQLEATSTAVVVETPTRIAEEEPMDEESADGGAMDGESTDRESMDGDSADSESMDDESMTGDSTDNDSSDEDAQTEEATPVAAATSVPTLPPTATSEPTIAPTPTALPTAVPTATPESNDTTSSDDEGDGGSDSGSTGSENMNSGDSSVSTAPVSSTSILGVVRSADGQLFAKPSGSAVAPLKVGDSVFIIGRTEDNTWLNVRTDEDVEGWMPRDDIVAFRLESVPVVDADAMTDGSSMAAGDSGNSSSSSDSSGATTGEAGSSEAGSSEAGSSEAGSSEAGSSEAGSSQTTGGESGSRSANEDTSTAPSAGGSSPVTSSEGTGGSTNTNTAGAASGSQTSTSPTSGSTAGSSPSSSALAGTVSSSITQLNVRSGSGVGFSPIGKVDSGDVLTVVGRSQNSQWLLVNNPLPLVTQGWVSSGFVSLNGSASSLPVVASPAASSSDNNGSIGNGSPGTSDSQAAGDGGSNDATASSNTSAAPVGGLSGKLVFQGQLGGTIYLYSFASGSLTELTNGFDPNLSPDGQRVAFTRLGGEGGVYIIDIDGTNERRIFASDQAPRSPSWSPAGDKIVFSRLTGEYRCTNVGFGICVKNNRFLSGFNKITKEERGLSRILLNDKSFRDLPALNTATTPDWVESGIVYGATSSLEYTQDTEDGPNTGVINQIIGYQDPAWQPNGGRIIFQAKEGSHWEIFGINPNGSGIAALTKPVTTLVDELPSNVAPVWSPDGNSIAYLSNRDSSNSAGPWRIWVMNADGGNKRPLPINVPINYQFNLEQMVHWGR